MDDFETLAKSATGQLQASYLAADVARLQPMLTSGDGARVTAAVVELQKWADGADSLRKAYASEWLSNARKALGGMNAEKAIAQYGRKVVPGEAMPAAGGVKARFAAKKPPGHVEHGGASDRLDPHHKPAPKIQHGMMAHPRLSAPSAEPAAAVADHAHAAGASLAGKAAKHGFKLGLAAAATIGAGAAAHHHLKQKGMDKGAQNEGLEKGADRIFREGEQFAGKIIQHGEGRGVPGLAATIAGGIRKGKLYTKLRQRAGAAHLQAAHDSGALDNRVRRSMLSVSAFSPKGNQEAIRTLRAHHESTAFKAGQKHFDENAKGAARAAAIGGAVAASAVAGHMESEKQRKQRSDAAKARWAKHKAATASPMSAAGV